MRQGAVRLVAQPLGQRVQHAAPQGAVALPLGHAPVVEAMAGRQVQSVEKLALQQDGRGFQNVDRRRQATAQHLVHATHVDQHIGGGEGNVLAVGIEALALLIVGDAAQLGQAPAQRAARIVRAVPQQIAQRLAQLRGAGRNQIAQQRTRALGGRQRHESTGALHLQLAKQADAQRGPHGCRGRDRPGRERIPRSFQLAFPRLPANLHPRSTRSKAALHRSPARPAPTT